MNLKKYAIDYYNKGYNCSLCILKAGEKKYNIDITNDIEKGIEAINGGFGFGGMCGVLVSAIILIGIIVKEEDLKMIRLKFIDEIFNKYNSFNCNKISNISKNNCVDLIEYVCDLIEYFIE